MEVKIRLRKKRVTFGLKLKHLASITTAGVTIVVGMNRCISLNSERNVFFFYSDCNEVVNHCTSFFYYLCSTFFLQYFISYRSQIMISGFFFSKIFPPLPNPSPVYSSLQLSYIPVSLFLVSFFLISFNSLSYIYFFFLLFS